MGCTVWPKEIFTLVIASIIVGVVIKLFAYWLDKHNDDQK
ncbi:MAG: type I toxin-antitoxin system Fst family toxin [Lactobacillaceae bacterium]